MYSVYMCVLNVYVFTYITKIKGKEATILKVTRVAIHEMVCREEKAGGNYVIML